MDANQAQLKALLEEKLQKNGERERLKELLRTRLVDSGWRDQLKAHCKELVREKAKKDPAASSNFSIEELLNEVQPFAKDTVPVEIKQELIKRIQDILAAENGQF